MKTFMNLNVIKHRHRLQRQNLLPKRKMCLNFCIKKQSASLNKFMITATVRAPLGKTELTNNTSETVIKSRPTLGR